MVNEISSSPYNCCIDVLSSELVMILPDDVSVGTPNVSILLPRNLMPYVMLAWYDLGII